MQVIKVPKVLLPKEIDVNKWSVIACDQFTSQPDYWREVEQYTKGVLSSYNLIFPEVFLKDNPEDRTERIQRNMLEYSDRGVFREYEGLILVKRMLNNGEVRYGIMLAVDLEEYDYTPSNNALIKATERTVVERLPQRIAVRRNASLELPHIMLLVDDTNNDIFQTALESVKEENILYDGELNMNGGRVTGYMIEDADRVLALFEGLLSDRAQRAKYNGNGKILFAVGDGNHSLATAKECWNEIKENLPLDERQSHPARYALCEVVNLYHLEFEPIHRLVLGADEEFISQMAASLSGDGEIKVTFKGKEYVIHTPLNPADAIKDIQDFIDRYAESRDGIEQDYIHGDNHLSALAETTGGVAIYMPNIAKEGLFDYCLRRGVLPRKSFSIGNAEDKRYYLEARKVIK